MTDRGIKSSGRRALTVAAGIALLGVCASPAQAQSKNKDLGISPAVLLQIEAIVQDKATLSGAQRKLDANLLHASRLTLGRVARDLPEANANALNALQSDANGRVKVQIRGTVSDGLLSQIRGDGGAVIYASAKNGSVLALVPASSLEALAARSDVSQVATAARASTNVGALTSQGYISHRSNEVVAAGYNGTGVRIGVLSDSASPARVAALISSGDLPADTVVLPGQDGGAGHDEGTAMMEIVSDMAPGAKLFFASAFNGVDSFADNIRALRNLYNCDIIVDDVTYFNEGAFQDGPIAQAVNDVTVSGALYFSSAGNSGNVSSGTSGTWEGDFSPAAAPLPGGLASYTLHDFGGGQAYDVLTGATTYITLKWSDPLSGSANDYDLFLLNSTGTAIVCTSSGVQVGAAGSTPFEDCYNSTGWPSGTRIVIASHTGAAPRALHLDTNRGRLSIGTNGATYGHNAGASTVSMAAVYWNAAKTGTKPFLGGSANPTETFSSDGPRKVFYNPDGSAITAGNYLFATGGGTTLVKPDLAAADGVSTKTPGFLPFFGTSASAPHAAGIAALIKSARPTYTNAQILQALKASALDIRDAGVDRDAGYGLITAKAALNYALTH